MIFIPEKEKCTIWNETDEYIFILFFADKDMEFPFSFHWYKDHNGKYDPFNLCLVEFAREFVQHCNMINCGDTSYPQLRYNKIVNKWFCCCSSSAICTKNDDKDEIESGLLDLKRDYDTLGDTPMDAVIKWNISIANGIKSINENIANELKNISPEQKQEMLNAFLLK